MSDDKELKREAGAIWDAIRRDRRERRRKISPAELNESAELLRAHADALGKLATKAPAAPTAPDEAAAPTPRPRAKPKRVTGKAKRGAGKSRAKKSKKK